MASQDWFDKDFYAVLGVSKTINEADLKKAYRKLARQYHPDSNPGDAKAEAKFKEISEAHSVLSNPELRKEYDQIRAMGSGARFSAGGQQGGGFEDVFGGMFGQQQRPGSRSGGSQSGGSQSSASFEDLLGGMFGSGGFGSTSGGFRGAGGPTRGRDLAASTTLDFVTAIRGETIKLQPVGAKAINVKIPAGVSDGQKIRLKGKGEQSPDGGAAGDLVLSISVRKHPVFERDGQNLRVVVPVTFVEATLGATIEVPTLGGDPVKLRVAAGTPSGRILRVKDRGVASTKGTGDLLAEIQVAVPARLTDDALRHLEAFAAAMPTDNPREQLLEKATSV